MKKTKKGFTLVELLVVIAILAILSVVSIIGFSSYTNKAKLSNDISLITQLNSALAYEASLGTVPKNMWEAKELLIEDTGYDISRNNTILTQYANIGYDVRENCVVLISNLTNPDTTKTIIECPEGYTPYSTYDIFVPMNNVYDNLYSTYLVDATSTEFETNKGFDSGECKVTSIVYENEGSAKDVVIRTNSFETTLTINSPLDNIKHYGNTGVVKLQQVSTSSYWEYGATAFIELSIGRIVLTKPSDVEIIYITKKDSNTYNNPIIADGGVLDYNMPEIISRDQVTVTDQRGKTELVRIQTLDANGNVIVSDSEQIYAYTYQNDGSTEKVTTGNVQNENITSSLGLIVLDGGNNAGEKAYSVAKKEEVRDQYVQVSIKASKYGGGLGTPEDPYIISTIEHLYAMSQDYVYNDLVEEYCNFDCYKLMSDLTVENWTIATIYYIKLSEQSVMPYCNAFGGQFDGNGHTIKFIWDCNTTEVDENNGISLFGEFIDSIGIEGYDRPGVMKNLTIDCDIDAKCDISPMFAYIWGDDCTVDNCHIKGIIKSDSFMGGISLFANSGNNVNHTIKNCTFDADVILNVQENSIRSKDYIYVSTFVCQTINKYPNTYPSPIKFENCTVTGSITIQYCTNINLIRYGTFYAANNSPNHQCTGINCIDNCTVNIASQYYDDGTQIYVSTLSVPNN